MTAGNSSRILTNDIYLAAYLLCKGCAPAGVLTNGRRRVSFLFTGGQAYELRWAYRSGVVALNVRSFRDNLFRVRKLITTQQRSEPCPKPQEAQATKPFPP